MSLGRSRSRPLRPLGKEWSAERAYHEQCERCKAWFPRVSLLRQLQQGLLPAGSNYLRRSSYAAADWTCTAASAGAVSQANSQWTQDAHQDNTVTSRGVQTWTGSGTLTSVGTFDASTWDSVLVRARCGHAHYSTAGRLDVVVGLRTDATTYPLAEWVVIGNSEVWGSYPVASILEADRPDLQVYFAVTTYAVDDDWWVDWMQVEPDLLEPPKVRTYIATTGTPVARSSDTLAYRAVVVCRKCRDQRIDLKTDINDSTSEPPELREDLEVD